MTSIASVVKNLSQRSKIQIVQPLEANLNRQDLTVNDHTSDLLLQVYSLVYYIVTIFAIS